MADGRGGSGPHDPRTGPGEPVPMPEARDRMQRYSIISALTYAALIALCAFVTVWVLISAWFGLVAAGGAFLAALFSWWLVMAPRLRPSVWRHAWLGFFTGMLSPALLAIVLSGPAAPVIAWPMGVGLGVPAAAFAIPFALLFGGLARSMDIGRQDDEATGGATA